MRTLSNEIALSGVGLHSGVQSTVRLLPSDTYGITFKTKNGSYRISSAEIEEDSRLTGFRLPDGTPVRTAEHLLASIVGMELDAVAIVLEGEEVPILDGSSHIFASEIDIAGCSEISGAEKHIALSSPIVIDAGAGKSISAAPSKEFQITYVIDYPNTPIGTQKADYTINRENFLNVISKARTFGLTYEFDYLKKYDLAKGGSLDNALVFDNDKLLNEGGLRFPLECVTHKVIDLLGDLALAGSVPVARYIAVCAGHGVHRKLVERFRRIQDI
ncbi:MAG: UDP-3-O-acyl-N-acetylglucosamine deacetylase [Synergistaceae bacterium]|nr:UDP-3-O-acyl-N-acetylglucosamine deacetylase [Synergistaceae bacterium]